MDYYQLLKTDYTWQNLSINEIHKILYGESSKKISGYDNVSVNSSLVNKFF